MPAIDPNCKLLLHCNGTDGSTTFTDSSGTSKSVTAVNNAQIDTAQSVFGGASGLFDGTNDYLTVPDHADWNLGTGDFTIDFRIRFNSTAATQQICGQDVDAENDWLFRWNSASNDWLFFWEVGNTIIVAETFAHTPSTNTWYHIALCRSGNNLKLFVDGTQAGSTANVTGDNYSDIGGSPNFTIGVRPIDTSDDLNGWIDEFNFVKGTALYTANFTPPANPYGTADSASSIPGFMTTRTKFWGG